MIRYKSWYCATTKIGPVESGYTAFKPFLRNYVLNSKHIDEINTNFSALPEIYARGSSPLGYPRGTALNCALFGANTGRKTKNGSTERWRTVRWLVRGGGVDILRWKMYNKIFPMMSVCVCVCVLNTYILTRQITVWISTNRLKSLSGKCGKKARFGTALANAEHENNKHQW